MKKFKLTSILFLFLTIGVLLNFNTMQVKAISVENIKPNKIWILQLSNPKIQSIKVLDEDKKIVSNIKMKISGKKIIINPPKDGWLSSEDYRIVLYTKNGNKTSSKVLKYFTVEDEEVKFIEESASIPIMKEVSNISILSIDDIVLTTNQNQPCELSNTVMATFSDNSKQEINVVWDLSYIVGKTLGENIIYRDGNIDGYDKDIKIILTVLPIIKEVNNIHVKLFINQPYELPKKVDVKMSDNTIKQVDVKWNVDKIDTSKEINTMYDGVIEGDKNVRLFLTVETPRILSTEKFEFTVNKNEVFTLPKTVTTTMSDGTSKQFELKWSNPIVNTQKAGDFIYYSMLIEDVGILARPILVKLKVK